MALSANTLFHFTKNMETIGSILRNGFYPRYCLEYMAESYPDKQVKGGYAEYVAIPMVCFCDIPLSQVGMHTEHYGSYAIGLSKDWGKRSNINPVMYIVDNAYVIESLKKGFEGILAYAMGDDIVEDKEVIRVSQEASRRIFYLARYMKLYEGKHYRDGKWYEEEIRFYDEREWRYVPGIEVSSENKMPYTLSLDEYNNRELREACNQLLGKYCALSFAPDDIRYIIVQSEQEILEMAEKIRNIKQPKFSSEEVDLLATRIISMERVREDF